MKEKTTAMNKYIESINYLVSKKTQDIPHGQDSLFQHSVNIYNKLRFWKCSEDVCFAGLFNFIYSIEKDRNIIQNIIGTKSENLIHKNLKIISLADKLVKTYIEIIDGYFDNQDILQNYIYFRDHVPWKFIGSGYDEFKWRKFKYEPNFKNKIEKNFKNQTNNILKKLNLSDLLKIERCYASANLYGTVHQSHRDYALDSNGGITVMYYLNNNWNLNYAGETVFYHNGEILKSIIPKPGRVIIFDGTIEHCARDIRRDVNDLRMVLTFKYNININ